MRAKKKRQRKPRDRDIPLSLYGLGFEEALADVMKVKPPEKKKMTVHRRKPT